MTNDAYLAAETRARVEIDRQLVACGWIVHSRDEMNLYAGQGVAVREFLMATGHGRADYLLFVDGKAVDAVEARRSPGSIPSRPSTPPASHRTSARW